MMGRPPKPTAIKAAEGNRGRRPLNKRELATSPEIPRPPKWLDSFARAEWKRLAPVLFELGVIRPADQTMLASLCTAIGTLVAARRQLDSLPEEARLLVKSKSGVRINPLVFLVKQQIELVHRIGAEFGLTPAARARLLTDETPIGVPRETLEGILATAPSGGIDDARYDAPLM
jgi:P27 family predicted phage terminase small subunit